MKALIIGLGSMGKRRIRNLHALGYEDVKAYDPREDRVQEAQGKYGITPIFNLEGVLNNSVDIVIVSTPPDHHLEYALMAVEAGKHVFIEASAIDDGLDKLLQLQSKSPIVIAPSSTMRFHPAVKTIKAIVDTKEIGTVLAFSHHFGQYLPKWHPYEDYRTFYVSDPIVGATIELVAFELVWLTWICGIPSKVAAMKGKFGTLDNTIDDLYQVRPYEFELPSERTQVFVVYDQDYLYVAAKLWDKQPDEITAQVLRQGSDIEIDDYFSVLN